jgi:hypothetical protein
MPKREKKGQGRLRCSDRNQKKKEHERMGWWE